MRQLAIVSTMAFCFWILAGCQASAGQQEQPSSKASPANTPTTNAGGGSIPAEADPQVARAKDDLAKRLGISADAMQVTAVQDEDWSDTSLGCPEAGKMYAQVITPGYRIIVEAQGKSYEYHTDKGSRVVLCSQ